MWELQENVSAGNVKQLNDEILCHPDSESLAADDQDLNKENTICELKISGHFLF